MKAKDVPSMLDELDSQEINSPEKQLWLAVIDRALKDYCFFFDKLFTYKLKFVGSDQIETNLGYYKTIQELHTLRWFLFSTNPQQFNMQYILENIYDNYEGIAKTIRDKAKQHFKSHVESIKDEGRFPRLIKYILSETNALNPEIPSVPLSFKDKRFHVIN